jgi:hypothetical protein
VEVALFAAREHFAQEARQGARRGDEAGYSGDVGDVCADGEGGEGEWAEWHWRCWKECSGGCTERELRSC